MKNIIIKLEKTYYTKGFFNIKVKYDNLFGENNSKIKIQLGEDGELIEGIINRTANNNKTPRIMAGIKYTKWVQDNFNEGENFQLQIKNGGLIVLEKLNQPI